MTGISLELTTTGFDTAVTQLNQLLGFERAELMEGIGAILESGARRRISEEKAGPDGEAWADWSTGYAGTRKAKHSLLVSSQALLDSIASEGNSFQVAVGSNLVYAAIHQLGGEAGRVSARVTIPARPYLGASSEDEADIEDFVSDFVTRVLQ